MKAALILLALVATLLFPACEDDGLSWTLERQRLDAARAVWAERGFPSYAFDYRRGCFCPPELVAPMRITVIDGRVAGAVYTGGNGRSPGEPVPEAMLQFLGPVEDSFDRITRAIEQRAPVFEVVYDPELGFPREVEIVECTGCVDAGFLETLSDLEPIPPGE